jgi:RNA polymerase sigma-70 factor (ECF subfamily)
MTESELIEKLRNREEGSLDHLYREYHSRVQAVVRKYIKNDWDTEEVVQDVFWTVYRKIDLFRGDSALWSWMYRIAANAAKMKLRKDKRVPIPLEDDVLKDIYARETGDDVNGCPDQQLRAKRIVELMQRYLEDSTLKNREVYEKMELDGVDKELVAEKLDLTVPAVKTRLHRMRVGLRELIEGDYLLDERDAS